MPRKKQKPNEKKEAKKEIDKIRKKQLELANKFKDDVVKKFKDIVKSVVIFGSIVRGDFHAKSDIDMLVIIDDTAARFTPEQKENFDFKLREIAEKISKDITVQPAWTLTEFWDMARIGHPLLYTIVRDGWALYDTGFFIPVRKLLEAGKIPTTLESVERFMQGAPAKIKRVETAKLYMIAEDLYYAMLNSAQAIIMYMGETPPTPKETPIIVKQMLVEKGLLEENYLKDLEEVIEFRKDVEHKEIKDVSGEKLDEFIDKTKKFVSRMEQLLMQLQKKKKERIIQRNYEVMIKAAVAVLKKLNKLPEDPRNLPKAIKTELIDTGRIRPSFAEVFKKVVTMRKMLDEDKVAEIPEREVELMREYVRRFVRDVGYIIEIEEINKRKKGKSKGTRRKSRKTKKKK